MIPMDLVRTPTTLDAHRATFVARLVMLQTERAELLLEKLALGNSKADSKRKEALAGQLADLQLGEGGRDQAFLGGLGLYNKEG